MTHGPRNLTELQNLTGDFGPAAVAECRWSAIMAWFMDEPDAVLSNTAMLAWEVMRMTRALDRHRLGYPRHDGQPWPMPVVFKGLTSQSRQEAERVASEIIADWERAGCPRMSRKRVQDIYKALSRTRAFLAKYPSHGKRAA